VARDYVFQLRPQLGASRLGPDLANLAGRKPSAPDEEDLLKFLYAGGSSHPTYRFLFEEGPIIGQKSSAALKLTGSLAAPEGRQVVPSERARSLVAYLTSLNSPYTYPEARPLPPAAKAAGHEAAGKEAKK
jgi:cytochrome c oxidase cbb3-type subunit 2